METIIETIRDWPVIVQGALGSGLFWAILLFGQKLNVLIAKKYSHISRKARISYLHSAIDQYIIDTVDSENIIVLSYVALIYRALRRLFMALLWLVLGLISNTLFNPLGIIGYLGALYYLLQAANIVAAQKDNIDPQAELDKAVDELTKLEGNNKT